MGCFTYKVAIGGLHYGRTYPAVYVPRVGPNPILGAPDNYASYPPFYEMTVHFLVRPAPWAQRRGTESSLRT